MKLRTIIFILSLLAFFSTLTGAYFYYTALESAAIVRVERQGQWQTETVRKLFDQELSNNQRAIRGLSGHDEMELALSASNKGSLYNANKILDNFNSAFKASVTYLIDSRGNTIASSNRTDSNSFVGKNYAFRPYFKQSIQGVESIYLALGVTSGKRGIYFSHAVYNNDSESPLGVVIMKIPVDKFENELLRMHVDSPSRINLITDPNGLIFMSNNDNYLFQLFENIPANQISEIVKSKQFGNTPPEWSGFEIISKSLTTNESENKYIFNRKEISTLPGWHIIHMYDKEEISEGIYAPFAKKIGRIVFVLCVFIGVAVTILYRMALGDLNRRRAAEDALKVSEQRYRRLTENAKDMIYRMSLPDGCYEFVNDASVNIFGYTSKEFYDSPGLIRSIIHPDWHDYFKEQWALLLEEKIPPFYEYQIIHKSGETKWINQRNVLIRDKKDGKPIAIEGIATDISEIKQVEIELRDTKDVLNAIFQSTADGILVVNEEGRIVFHNERFQELWRIPDDLINSGDDEKLLDFVLAQLSNADVFFAKVHTLYKTDKEDFDILYLIDERIFERYSRPLFQVGKIAGRVWSFRDVTEKKQSEKEREKLILDLQRALNEVKTLRGIIPICSSCKKIRDDKGSWNQIEQYIHEHSDATFSHGICQECSDKLYGDQDWYVEMNKEEG
ncbi:MAG: PAS domain S-box protein [Bacteroidetes bacterium]|nr:PAS domain S-box protein [Bacteroidota bacterium]